MTTFLWAMAALFSLRLLVLLVVRPGQTTKPWTSGQLFSSRLLQIALLVWVAVLLTGCGGGDADDDRPDTQPVNCKLTPELCK